MDVVFNTGLLIVAPIFQGQIVVTALPVLEPRSFTLAGVGLITLVPAVRRRLRKA